MKVIGVTGGVGSGKTGVVEYIRKTYKARVMIADLVAHKVMEPGNRGHYEIVEYFGSQILNGDMTINRQKLSGIVFQNRGKLEKLNSIVHPLVKEYISSEIDREKKERNVDLIVIEAALLIEDHYELLCDELWYIYAHESVRRERLRAFRGYTEEKINNIISNQATEEFFREHCQVVIDNSGSLEETYIQIDRHVGGI